MKRCRRNWSDLHEDLLILIATKLQFLKEFCAFRSVCVSWRSAAAKVNFTGIRRLPWLLQAKEAGKKQLLALDNGKFYETNLFSDKIESWCLGWKGWVLVFEENRTMYLLHIFEQIRIKLPLKQSFEGNKFEPVYVKKAALSSNPFRHPHECTLMIMDSNSDLAYWRPGDESYTIVPRIRGILEGIFDVIFHKGLFYAISTCGEIHVFDVVGPKPKNTFKIVGKVPHPWLSGRHFLVDLGGDLLVITRMPRCTREEFNYFHVFVFSESKQWKEINDLGNKAILIGRSASFAIDNASEIPGCMPNCIYSTDEVLVCQRHHMVIYNLTNGRIEYSKCCTIEEPSRPPLWIQPS